MPKWRALDPTPEALAEALGRAIEEANRDVSGDGSAWLASTPETWRAFLAEAAGSPEGARVWFGPEPHERHFYARVVAAWWTDALGRRHWFIEGRSVFGNGPEQGPPAHPLLLIAGPRAALVERAGKSPRLFGFCDCGELGPVEALAWVGECCGPCHDRRLEGVSSPTWGLPFCLLGVGGVLAFSPDGRWVLTGRPGTIGQRLVRLEVDSGREETLKPALPWGAGTPPADGAFFLSDKSLITWHDQQSVVGHAGEPIVIWWDWRAGVEVQRYAVSAGEGPYEFVSVEGVAANGTLLLAREQGLWLLDCSAPPGPDGPPVRGRLGNSSAVGSWALSGPWAARVGGDGEWRLLDLRAGSESPQPRLPRGGAWVSGAADVPLFAVGSWSRTVRLFEPATGTWAELSGAEGRGLALDSAGRWLASGGRDAIAIWDVRDSKGILKLHVALGDPDLLAFSPGGDLLAAGGRLAFGPSPLCIWPWRRLVEG
jgi:hypothetical protein